MNKNCPRRLSKSFERGKKACVISLYYLQMVSSFQNEHFVIYSPSSVSQKTLEQKWTHEYEYINEMIWPIWWNQYVHLKTFIKRLKIMINSCQHFRNVLKHKSSGWIDIKFKDRNPSHLIKNIFIWWTSFLWHWNGVRMQ